MPNLLLAGDNEAHEAEPEPQAQGALFSAQLARRAWRLTGTPSRLTDAESERWPAQLYFFEERFRLQIEMLGRDPESIKAILQEVLMQSKS